MIVWRVKLSRSGVGAECSDAGSCADRGEEFGKSSPLDLAQLATGPDRMEQSKRQIADCRHQQGEAEKSDRQNAQPRAGAHANDKRSARRRLLLSKQTRVQRRRAGRSASSPVVRSRKQLREETFVALARRLQARSKQTTGAAGPGSA